MVLVFRPSAKSSKKATITSTKPAWLWMARACCWIFEGRQALFAGLAADSGWDWRCVRAEEPVLGAQGLGRAFEVCLFGKIWQEPEALLFQAGYLTVLQSSQPLPGQWVYTLGYPNREVESSLNAALLRGFRAPERSCDSSMLVTISGWSTHLTILVLAKFCQKV
jgi:hypothetical protein